MASAPPFGKPKDDEVFVFDGLDEVDDNPWYIEPGDHEAQCTDLENGTSKEGNPKVIFTFTVTKGPMKGKDIKAHLARTEAAMWKLKQVLAGLGLNVKQKRLQFSKKDVVGKPCILVVEDNDFNGEKRSNIKTVKPVGGAPKAA